jgi:4-carboxymuconolactone decarboxylase
MSKPAAPASARRDRLKPHVPALVDYTSSVIYGDVWERKDLSKRDRSLVTVAALVACYRPEQLNTHIQRALQNGVTKEEIAGVITHLAFYCGWPGSMTAAHVLADVMEGTKV